jgi:hypothetical protein
LFSIEILGEEFLFVFLRLPCKEGDGGSFHAVHEAVLGGKESLFVMEVLEIF